PSRSKAWSVALLLPHDVDVTVMTWVAPPSPCRRSTSRGAGTAGAEAGRGVGVRLAVVVSGGGAGRAAAGRGTVVGGGNGVAGGRGWEKWGRRGPPLHPAVVLVAGTWCT